ncbi:hypothetical protein N480_03565 [Pseudoalteromonas luteoviolacea S2607]|uniref:DUF2971 domain-containing protein n=1 Tax=Pseudoalteromonas luteoviolacea TaxID=43657 RepID=UPI0007B03BF9|nr:DUF2971 domain-containing protein [Pseudoalteromonas luteoviolacea]KZN30035.1 hypothetical protein N480_03565 [Pseudoalteromonas luteoviolacea S2607]
MKVYKYLPLTDGSKCILTDGTMKFSHHSEFNDPFDCKLVYDIEKSMEYLKSRPDLLKEAGRRLKLTPAQRLAKKKQMEHSIRRSLESGEFHNSVIENVGICCLTKKPDNILMWSHYADNHKGVAIEFNVNDASNNINMANIEEKLFGWDIEYTDYMPKIIAGARDFDTVKDVFLKKSLEWAYEAEYRVLSMKKGPGIHRFDQQLISRVIAGVNMPEKDFLELYRLINKTGLKIELVRAKMSKTKYQILVT